MYGVAPPTRPPRPGTINALEVLLAIKAALALLATGRMAWVTFASRGDHARLEIRQLGILLVMAGFAALYLLVASRIGRGREWARITAIVLESLALAIAPFAIAGSDVYVVIALIVSMAGSIAVIGCATHGTAFRYCRGR